MIKATKLFEMIKCASNLDFWFDYEQEHAINLYKTLDDEDFHYLQKNWQSQSDSWKYKFASILNTREDSDTASILKELIDSEDYDTASMALYELRNFDDQELLKHTKGLKEALTSFDKRHQTHRKQYEEVLSDFLYILEHEP